MKGKGANSQEKKNYSNVLSDEKLDALSGISDHI